MKRTPGYPSGHELANATTVLSHSRSSENLFRSTKLSSVLVSLESKSSSLKCSELMACASVIRCHRISPDKNRRCSLMNGFECVLLNQWLYGPRSHNQ